MQVPKKYYTEIFEFSGQWDIPSKCGLKIIERNNKTYIIVTELYQENTGTSVTYAGKSLAVQICEAKGFQLQDVVYLECTPDTNSVLSFYNEEYYEVNFDTEQPAYRLLTEDEIKAIYE